MKKTIALFFVFLMFSGSLIARGMAQNDRVIVVGEEISESLKAGSVHAYTIQLDAKQFVFGRVMQHSADVEVTIYNPEGKKAAEFNNTPTGRQIFQWNTKAEGDYRIEVKSVGEEDGDYSILVSLVEPTADDPAGRADQMMMEYSGDDVPGAGVMVIKDGDAVFQNSYGMASLAYEIPMQEQTVHNIGSTSKHFLTFGLMLLEDEGKLSMDDDVRKYIPELPDFGQTVTLRHIVTHTSGYREYINLIAMTGRNISSDLRVEKIIEIVQRQPELQNEPGAEWNYNNTGYALATEVIERVTGTPFPEWMKKSVFEPIGMHHTVVRTSPHQIVANRSTGYIPAGNEAGFSEVTDLGGAMGAGGIHTTMGDLAKWIQNLIHPRVGSEEIIEKMMTPFELNDGEKTEYGLGLFVQEYKGLKYVHHGGGDMAHRSMLIYFPEIRAAVVTQSNYSAFAMITAQKIADLFFGDYMEAKPEEDQEPKATADEPAEFEYNPENFDPLTGRYELDAMRGFILTFSREEDRIYAQATGQPEVNLSASSDSTFSLVGVQAAITFHRNEDGTADSLTLHQNGNHIARKIDFELSTTEMQEYTGRYFSNEIETLYHIVVKDSTLLLQHYQLAEDIELTPSDKDSFGAGFPLTNITFVRNENGDITGFKASNGRTRDVLFEKRQNNP